MKVFLNNMLPTSLFSSPKVFPKTFKIFLLNLSKLQLLIFRCLKLAIVKINLISELLASALLVTFVENELSLEP